MARRFPCCVLLFAAITLLAASRAARAADAPADDQFFETKVRPLLADRCYKCHSASAQKLKGKLRLDSRDDFLRGGESGPEVVAARPQESRLITAVMYKDPDLQMPPKSKLTDEQVAILTKWVEGGAPWPKSAGGGGAVAAPVKSAFDLQQRKASHWAWQPIRAVQPPTVKDVGWAAQNLIDRFILARLEEKGLHPAPPADRRTLLRRVTFDLTGLPPTPAEVDAFVGDASSDAFAKVVDRLLTSPAFGERWARHWLDLVRYSETRGHEYDFNIPNAYQYRDYVIRAFNADVPYDQFVTEHVAGDLLPHPRHDATGEINESILGTGFWYMGEWLHSPVDIREDETNRIDNQIDVFGKAFLGLTIGCARCHDHKFDAISQKDYYALSGFMQSASFRNAAFMHEDANRAVLQRVSRLDAETRAQVAEAFIAPQRAGLNHLGETLVAACDAMKGRNAPTGIDSAALAAWVADLKKAQTDPADPLHALAIAAQEPDAAPEQLAARLRDCFAERGNDAPASAAGAPGATPSNVVVDYADCHPGDWIVEGSAFGAGPVPAGRLVVGTDANAPIAAIADRAVADSRAATNPVPGMLRTRTFEITSPKLTMRVSGTGEAFIEIDGHRMIAGPLHGVARQKIKTDGKWQDKTVDLSPYLGQHAHIEFTADKAVDFVAVAGVWQADRVPSSVQRAAASNRLLRAALLDSPPHSIAEVAAAYQRLFLETAEKLRANTIETDADAGERARLAEWLVHRADRLGYGGDAVASVKPLLASYQKQRDALHRAWKASPTAMAMLDANGHDEHLLRRGSHKTPGDLVPRRLLEAIAGPNQPPVGPGSGRLELARRIVDPSDPLLPRVMVNRIWHHLLGRGIVASVDNFGVLGEAPTHPELLDYLAAQFTTNGWSNKKLIRAIVLSNTYQMSSLPSDPAAEEADPQDLLLHRARVRRLEAEAIRDEMLAVSGRLDPTMFGPSVEVHLTPFMDGRGKPSSGPLDGNGRRSLYTKVRRNFLSPMMLAFDAPAPFNCMGRRTVSNVPAQALTLLNDPFVIEQAKLWAARVLADKDLQMPRQRLDRMYTQAFARLPRDDEAAAAETFLDRQGAELGVAPAARASDPQVWADLAHVLINVKEFIYVN